MIEFAIALLVKRNPRSLKKMLEKKTIPGNTSLFKNATSISQLMAGLSTNTSTGKKIEKRRSSKGIKIQNLEDLKNENDDGRKKINLSSHNFIDLVSSILFPISYLIFNIIYWLMVL